MLKRFFFIVCTFLLVIVVLFLISEFFFRTFRGPPHPLVRTTQKSQAALFKPNTRERFISSKEGEYDYVAHFNRFGYRGKDFELEKQEGVTRILVIGDSFTFGVGAEDDETIAAVMEQQLKSNGYPVEVINAGVGHSSPINHYINLKQIHLRYQPDIVVLLYDLTDLQDDWKFERNAVKNPSGEIIHFDPTYINGKRDWWLVSTFHSAFCRYLNNKLVKMIKKGNLLGWDVYLRAAKENKRAKALIANSDDIKSDEALLTFDHFVMMRGAKRKDVIDRHWGRSAKYILKIRDLLASKDIPLVLGMYPHGIYVGKTQWNQGRVPWGFEQDRLYTDDYPFQLVGGFAQEYGIPFINTLDHFLKAPPKKYFFDYDGHMTADGYAIVGKAIAADQIFFNMLRKE